MYMYIYAMNCITNEASATPTVSVFPNFDGGFTEGLEVSSRLGGREGSPMDPRWIPPAILLSVCRWSPGSGEVSYRTGFSWIPKYLLVPSKSKGRVKRVR